MYFLQFTLLYSLFYLTYRLGLSKTGQLTANRLYLLACYVFALVLPLLPWPELTFLPESASIIAPFAQTIAATPPIDANTPLTGSVTELVQATFANGQGFNYVQALIAVYLAGVCLFLLRYGLQLWSLRRLISRSSPLNDHRWAGKARLLDKASQNNLAFTYGSCFYVSPNLLKSPDAELIMEHEYAHARQLHTIDLTIAELLTTLLWWHPVAWLHRRDLRLNLEFLADRAVLNTGYSPKNYQLSLLRFCESFVARPALTFSQSPLKTRIIMMKSKKRSTSIYLSLVAAVLLTGGVFTACSTQEINTEAPLVADVPFAKTFMGQEGWEQAHSLLVNNYAEHQIEYFVNGSPAQNEIIPKPEDIKIVELAANTDAPNLTNVSFTTLQSNWVSAFGWHASEENSKREAQSYNDWTIDLISEQRGNSYATAFYGNPHVYDGAFDYMEEEYPDAATVFYLDGEPSDIDALKTPVEDVKVVVVAYANGDMKKVIYHVITSAS